MKTILSTLCATLALAGSTQNLVLDPGFERSEPCPGGPSQISSAKHWSSPNRATPDYFNTCSHHYASNVPFNMAGKQSPRSGNGYAGVITQANELAYTELVQGELAEPMVKGAYYKVSYYVSLASIAKYIDPRLGAFFAKDSVAVNDRRAPLPERGYAVTLMKVPQMTDAGTWQLVTGIYKAKGDERFIVIGNVQGSVDRGSMKKNKFSKSQVKDAMGYYYIDDVSVVRSKSRTDTAFVRTVEVNTLQLEPGPPVILGSCGKIFKNGSSAYQDVKAINADARQDTGFVPEFAMLDYFSNFLIQNPEVSVEIGVRHADVMDADMAEALTQARATAIMRTLVEMGCSKKNLTAVGHGTQACNKPGMPPVQENEDGRIEVRITEVEIPPIDPRMVDEME